MRVSTLLIGVLLLSTCAIAFASEEVESQEVNHADSSAVDVVTETEDAASPAAGKAAQKAAAAKRASNKAEAASNKKAAAAKRRADKKKASLAKKKLKAATRDRAALKKKIAAAKRKAALAKRKAAIAARKKARKLAKEAKQKARKAAKAAKKARIAALAKAKAAKAAKMAADLKAKLAKLKRAAEAKRRAEAKRKLDAESRRRARELKEKLAREAAARKRRSKKRVRSAPARSLIAGAAARSGSWFFGHRSSRSFTFNSINSKYPGLVVRRDGRIISRRWVDRAKSIWALTLNDRPLRLGNWLIGNKDKTHFVISTMNTVDPQLMIRSDGVIFAGAKFEQAAARFSHQSTIPGQVIQMGQWFVGPTDKDHFVISHMSNGKNDGPQLLITSNGEVYRGRDARLTVRSSWYNLKGGDRLNLNPQPLAFESGVNVKYIAEKVRKTIRRVDKGIKTLSTIEPRLNEEDTILQRVIKRLNRVEDKAARARAQSERQIAKLKAYQEAQIAKLKAAHVEAFELGKKAARDAARAAANMRRAIREAAERARRAAAAAAAAAEAKRRAEEEARRKAAIGENWGDLDDTNVILGATEIEEDYKSWAKTPKSVKRVLKRSRRASGRSSSRRARRSSSRRARRSSSRRARRCRAARRAASRKAGFKVRNVCQAWAIFKKSGDKSSAARFSRKACKKLKKKLARGSTGRKKSSKPLNGDSKKFRKLVGKARKTTLKIGKNINVSIKLNRNDPRVIVKKGWNLKAKVAKKKLTVKEILERARAKAAAIFKETKSTVDMMYKNYATRIAGRKDIPAPGASKSKRGASKSKSRRASNKL